MVQYSVWTNCCNNCKFCLRKQRRFYSKQKQLIQLERIKNNIKIIDWNNNFSYGISLLGGQLYYITDIDLQQSFLQLIDIIIQYILKPSTNIHCRYSTVTNGLYQPTFLYKVVDKIQNQVGLNKLDINFSYDLKYRFKSQQDRLLCLNNINNFHKKYNYIVGVQMILTEYLIQMCLNNQFSINKFIQNDIPGNNLALLYPHPIHTGIELDDFFFTRNQFLQFLKYLKTENYNVYRSFLYSTKNSCTFKYTGLRDKKRNDYIENPILSDGKQILNQKCGHSILYKCYKNSNKCMLCDLKMLQQQIYI